jgi:hypothetical protein
LSVERKEKQLGKRKYSDDDLAALSAHVKARCLEAFELASEVQREAGEGWYSSAHEEAKLLASFMGVNVARAAAIIAVLSPLTRWTGNLEDSWAVANGDATRHTLPANVVKAKRLTDGESIHDVLGGRKVRAFWQNIASPTTSVGVTHDSWMARWYNIPASDVFATFGVYDACTVGVREAADEVDLRGSQLQAIVWLYVRDLGTVDETLPNPFERT